ncbi:citrate synthase, mitochondrial [Cinnamomum micranthum f. kanehirae]|uniref:Citrate synthase, mitochondrial n=1 Tax=Cinnamomum micranthum f. kanehirae TaxID=337451 RepID=A0A3S3PL61_9MAGN|nr:citrate synthase, mitochondrial [Cinnamomum micranthum f. kanehirae]
MACYQALLPLFSTLSSHLPSLISLTHLSLSQTFASPPSRRHHRHRRTHLRRHQPPANPTHSISLYFPHFPFLSFSPSFPVSLFHSLCFSFFLCFSLSLSLLPANENYPHPSTISLSLSLSPLTAHELVDPAMVFIRSVSLLSKLCSRRVQQSSLYGSVRWLQIQSGSELQLLDELPGKRKHEEASDVCDDSSLDDEDRLEVGNYRSRWSYFLAVNQDDQDGIEDFCS